MDNISSKHHLIMIVISITALILWLTIFFLSTLKYCLYIYKIGKFEENEPFIDLSGIQSFSFDKTTLNNPEYKSSIPNLGYTGDLIFDCYEGKCTYYKK